MTKERSFSGAPSHLAAPAVLPRGRYFLCAKADRSPFFPVQEPDRPFDLLFLQPQAEMRVGVDIEGRKLRPAKDAVVEDGEFFHPAAALREPGGHLVLAVRARAEIGRLAENAQPVLGEGAHDVFARRVAGIHPVVQMRAPCGDEHDRRARPVHDLPQKRQARFVDVRLFVPIAAAVVRARVEHAVDIEKQCLHFTLPVQEVMASGV